MKHIKGRLTHQPQSAQVFTNNPSGFYSFLKFAELSTDAMTTTLATIGTTDNMCCPSQRVIAELLQIIKVRKCIKEECLVGKVFASPTLLRGLGG